jgi:hypothetical protein
VYTSPLRRQSATGQDGEDFDPIVMSIMSEVPRYATSAPVLALSRQN